MDEEELERQQLEQALANSLLDVQSGGSSCGRNPTRNNEAGQSEERFENQEMAFFTDRDMKVGAKNVVASPAARKGSMKGSPVVARSSPLAQPIVSPTSVSSSTVPTTATHGTMQQNDQQKQKAQPSSRQLKTSTGALASASTPSSPVPTKRTGVPTIATPPPQGASFGGSRTPQARVTSYDSNKARSDGKTGSQFTFSPQGSPNTKSDQAGATRGTSPVPVGTATRNSSTKSSSSNSNNSNRNSGGKNSFWGGALSAAAAAIIGSTPTSTSSKSNSATSASSNEKPLQPGTRICRSCKKACEPGQQIVSGSNDFVVHAKCFVCGKCKRPITGSYVLCDISTVAAPAPAHGSSSNTAQNNRSNAPSEPLPYHQTCLEAALQERAAQNGMMCKACGKACTTGRYLTTPANEVFHAACFCCDKCKRPIEGSYSLHAASEDAEKRPYHGECLQQMLEQNAVQKGLVCKGCGKVCINCRYFTTPSGDHYHEGCFRCDGCGKPIDGQYSVRGDPPGPYHPQCGVELFNPRCCLCCHAIDGQYQKHPFFDSEVYCFSHVDRQTCFACGRKEPLESSNRDGFTDLMDGRSLCDICAQSIIVDSTEAADIYQAIVTFMESGLGLEIPADMWKVPVFVVDVQSLNENISNQDGEMLGAHEHNRFSGDDTAVPTVVDTSGTGVGRAAALALTKPGANIIRGVTLSKRRQIRHISGRLSISSLNELFKAMSSAGASSPSPRSPLPTELYRTEETRDVSAVLVLYGLPRDLIASIIAHEAMHVWLKLNKGFPFQLPPKIEEGLCQVVAYLYLEHVATHRNIEIDHSLSTTASTATNANATNANATNAATNAADSETQNDSLRSFFHYQIMQDQSEVYGDGFREAYKVVAALGLNVTLDYLKQNSILPAL